jgi:kynurenine 3-monooxygenase
MSKGTTHIGIIGAGLVGSLLAIYLSKRGYRISVFERREDPRRNLIDEGRSINLALSTRGIKALEEVGLAEPIRKLAIPMHGRIMHDITGSLTFQPYGKQGQFINSISRAALNNVLINKAEGYGVRFFFGYRCSHVGLKETSASFQTSDGSSLTQAFDLLSGADGVFSAVRGAMQVTDRFNYSQHYLEHGYKELHIPADATGNFVMEKNALHIWPRESFMMIALPNPDGTFTCTLFFPFHGKFSFEALQTDESVLRFFNEAFPDATRHMPHLLEDFSTNPTSSLVTIKCFPWARHNTFLIGDAAHGIVPFYGQGMNAGFEDCRILNQVLDEHGDDWSQVLHAFQEGRKKDSDAIAELAVDNFVEMRDRVADAEFLLRKKIEARLYELYPEKWIPLYSMVTFHENIPYSKAYELGKKQERIMDRVMKRQGIVTNWQELDFKEIADELFQPAI